MPNNLEGKKAAQSEQADEVSSIAIKDDNQRRPSRPTAEEEELSDEELGQVAGGNLK